MKCPRCGWKILHDANYCERCGLKVNRDRSLRLLPACLGLLVVLLVVFAVYIVSEHRQTKMPNNYSLDKCYTPKIENVVWEDENCAAGYVNNMILIFFSPNATQQQISSAISKVDGTVVGKISGLNQYQVEVAPMARNKLDSLCRELEQLDGVVFAIVDNVVSIETSSTNPPNDPWKDILQGLDGVDWDEEHPNGSNWWLEATKVLSAWHYEDSFSAINVGVVDNGYDVAHEDLRITVLNGSVNTAKDHGTHVAGIIGATVNNRVGISGILKDVHLYGVDCYATKKQEKAKIAVSSLYEGIVMCLENHCKVINMSSVLKYDAFESAQEVRAAAQRSGEDAARYLIYMHLTHDEDFIIVESAGNGNKQKIGIDSAEYGGFFCSLNEDILRKIITENMDVSSEDGLRIDEDVLIQQCMDSVMIVAAADKPRKDGQYQLAKFSNYGDAITVCAPGVGIFSTVVSGGLNGSYGYIPGTSMAAPIVAGITAMVWSIDQDMSAGEVKDIIVSTALQPVLSRQGSDDGNYYLVDAKAAVEKVINPVGVRDGKLLTQVNVTSNAGYFQSFGLNYDEKQRLSSVDFADGTYNKTLEYTYDAHDRLIEVDCDDFWLYFADAKYSYNSDGNLVRRDNLWGGADPYWTRVYEYDSDGNLGQVSEVHEYGMVSIGRYTSVCDRQGRIVERHMHEDEASEDKKVDTPFGEYLRAECVGVIYYTYDQKGRLTEERGMYIPRNQYSPYGNEGLRSKAENIIRYNYNHSQFVLVQYHNPQGFFIKESDAAEVSPGRWINGYVIEFWDAAGNLVWCQDLGNGPIDVDEDGYIIRATDLERSFTCELIYGDEVSAE